MSKELEALHTIAFNTQINGMNFGNELRTIEQYILKAQEQEKILKIIFEKNVDVYTLFDLGFEEYNKWVLQRYGTYYQLIEEEFNLLKEVEEE